MNEKSCASTTLAPMLSSILDCQASLLRIYFAITVLTSYMHNYGSFRATAAILSLHGVRRKKRGAIHVHSICYICYMYFCDRHVRRININNLRGRQNFAACQRIAYSLFALNGDEVTFDGNVHEWSVDGLDIPRALSHRLQIAKQRRQAFLQREQLLWVISEIIGLEPSQENLLCFHEFESEKDAKTHALLHDGLQL